MKIYEYDVGHMTKMAVKPIYGKNPSKIFFSGTGGPISTKLGMQHRGLQPITVVSNDNPGLTLTYFTAWSKFVTWAFPWEKVKTVDFPETIAASDLKFGRYRQLIKLMKICEYSRSRSFLTLVQSYLHMKIKTCISQKPLGHFQLNGVCNILGTRK